MYCKKVSNIVIGLCSLVVLGCGACSFSQPKTTIPYYSYSDDEEETTEYESSDIISIPYRENGGVKIIKVSLNGMTVDMIFDTGCSRTLISIAEAQYLYNKGFISDDDFIGMSHSQIADGSIVENMVINLDRIVIDEKLSCTNVQATVCLNSEAPLLLGNEVLNRAASYTIDNENKLIKFKLHE